MFGLLHRLYFLLGIWPLLDPISGPAPDSQGGFELSNIIYVGSEQQFGVFSFHSGSVQISSHNRGAIPIATKTLRVPRLLQGPRAEIEKYWSAARHAKKWGTYDAMQSQLRDRWQMAEVSAPDVSDRGTVVLLAEMAANAYVPTPHEGDWTNVSTNGEWSHNGPGFGWEEDGVRGYVFSSKDKKTVVIALKGTSAAIFDDGGPTAPNDKTNDNLFFSCCCARISYMWSTVCDCYMGSEHGSSQCDEDCVEQALWEKDKYYRGVLDIYSNVTALYPNADIWLTGHSLGGALASLLGRTYGLPAVAFEAPGERMAVSRLHLPVPPSVPVWDDYVWHIGHNADPIFTGDCNGAGSSCWIAGYAMETKCHTGFECVYDVVQDLGWRSSVANHRIHVVIEEVLLRYNTTPVCRTSGPCGDCEAWDLIDPADPSPTPTSITTSTQATSIITSTSVTTTSSESVCITRAWYGRCRKWGKPTATTESGAVSTSA